MVTGRVTRYEFIICMVPLNVIHGYITYNLKIGPIRPTADDANNWPTQIYRRIVNTLLVVVFVLLMCQINAEVCTKQ